MRHLVLGSKKGLNLESIRTRKCTYTHTYAFWQIRHVFHGLSGLTVPCFRTTEPRFVAKRGRTSGHTRCSWELSGHAKVHPVKLLCVVNSLSGRNFHLNKKYDTLLYSFFVYRSRHRVFAQNVQGTLFWPLPYVS